MVAIGGSATWVEAAVVWVASVAGLLPFGRDPDGWRTGASGWGRADSSPSSVGKS